MGDEHIKAKRKKRDDDMGRTETALLYRSTRDVSGIDNQKIRRNGTDVSRKFFRLFSIAPTSSAVVSTVPVAGRSQKKCSEIICLYRQEEGFRHDEK